VQAWDHVAACARDCESCNIIHLPTLLITDRSRSVRRHLRMTSCPSLPDSDTAGARCMHLHMSASRRMALEAWSANPSTRSCFCLALHFAGSSKSCVECLWGRRCWEWPTSEDRERKGNAPPVLVFLRYKSSPTTPTKKCHVRPTKPIFLYHAQLFLSKSFPTYSLFFLSRRSYIFSATCKHDWKKCAHRPTYGRNALPQI
jgi:hypothetical protein